MENRPCYPIILIPQGVKVGNLEPIILPSKSTESTKLGASEIEFGLILRKYFDPQIFSQQQLLPLNHKAAYSADFLFVEPNTNLHIDLEIDEPFTFETREPIHCVGMDDYRNQCFVQANWIVLRFAEEQVKSQPLRCLRVLANIIYQYTYNDAWQLLFKDVEKLTPLWQWTTKKSRKLSKDNYRNRYLN
ncbi:hypothetical protein [Nostoc sp. FACHB-280]|uniref:hypothetical protein n=1 Tax=Nostoc sp. FACHB-280 TaxID=2692839 RepID=UPI00168BBE47|nr:hypothetical protein [Nostoc sp. FACHB-280]MBD2498333.1 hypothetical protein [Nostoc sp. FACHB-280]